MNKHICMVVDGKMEIGLTTSQNINRIEYFGVKRIATLAAGIGYRSSPVYTYERLLDYSAMLRLLCSQLYLYSTVKYGFTAMYSYKILYRTVRRTQPQFRLSGLTESLD